MVLLWAKSTRHTNHNMKNYLQNLRCPLQWWTGLFDLLEIHPIWSLTLIFTKMTIFMLISETHGDFIRGPPSLSVLDLADLLSESQAPSWLTVRRTIILFSGVCEGPGVACSW